MEIIHQGQEEYQGNDSTSFKDALGDVEDKVKDSTKGNNKIHSEMHELVKEIRDYFQEDAKKGKGSFGFYLGFFKRMPNTVVYRYWKEAKQLDKPIEDQKRLFWWKVGKYTRNN